MAHHAQTETERGVDVFTMTLSELAFLHLAQQRLRLCLICAASFRCCSLQRTGQLLLFLGDDALVFAQTAVLESHKTLSNLEEVLIRLSGHEFEVELLGVPRFESGGGRSDVEGVLPPLSSLFVQDAEQLPVNFNWVSEVILH